MDNRWTLACLVILFFIFIIILFVVKQLTLLSHASYQATMHYMMPYMNECYHAYQLNCIKSVCIYLLIIQMSHLTRTAFSPDDESDYENTNRNMRDLDPDYNCITNNNVLTTKYYLENDFNDIIKSNDDYVKGFSLSLMHLNVRSIPKNIDKLNSYLLSLDIQFSIIGLTETWLKEETLD